MFKNILLPTDGSDQALRAARLGVALAEQVGARVHAYHVLAPLVAFSCFSDRIRCSPEDYKNEAIKRARQQLDVIHAIAREANVPFDGSYAFDQRPYLAIVGAASQYNCDLIVMGTHGYTGMDRLVLGGETQKVLSCSDVPVLVCH